MHGTVIICSSADGYLDWFHSLTTVNRAAIIMGEQMSSVWKDIESYAFEEYKPLTPLSHNLFIYK